MTQSHRIVEIMASMWDTAGHRPPRNWRVLCSCDWIERGFKTRGDASDAWQRHVGDDKGAA